MSDYNLEIINRTDCKPWRDADTLRWVYHSKDLSSRDAAALLGTTKSTILHWMGRHDIDRRPGPNRQGPWREKETLQTEYVEKGRSMGDLADEWDTSTATISNWLSRHGIDHRHDHPSGEDHWNWIDGRSPGCGESEGWDLPERECAYCDSSYKPSHHRQEYCTSDCASKSLQKRVEITCGICGEVFEVPECREERASYCTYECLGKSNREKLAGTRIGEDNPNWKGGVKDRYYGPSWKSSRERAVERDNHECQVCGHSEMVHVHHIIPFKRFGLERHKEANDLDNLITLCPSHHMEWEGIPLRPQVAD